MKIKVKICSRQCAPLPPHRGCGYDAREERLPKKPRRNHGTIQIHLPMIPSQCTGPKATLSTATVTSTTVAKRLKALARVYACVLEMISYALRWELAGLLVALCSIMHPNLPYERLGAIISRRALGWTWLAI